MTKRKPPPPAPAPSPAPEKHPDEAGEQLGPQAAAAAALEDEQAGDGQTAAGTAGPDDQNQIRDTLAGIAQVASALLAKRWPRVKLDQAESEALATAWTPVLQKYAPGGIPIELVAVGVTVAILAPKVAAQVAAEREVRRQARPEPIEVHAELA